METLATALDRLRARGYRDQFRAEDAALTALDAGKSFLPEDLVVDEIVRFEGMTDVGDESAIFALRSSDGEVQGTYVVAYGPSMDARDAELVPRLDTKDSDRT